MKNVFLASLAMMLIGHAYSQQPSNSLGLGFGLKHIAFSNRYLSYLNAEGTAARMAIEYQRESAKSFFGVTADLVSGDLASDYEFFSPSIIDLNLRLDYARRMNTHSIKSQWYVGLGLTSGFWLLEDNFEDLVDLLSTIPSHNLEIIGRWNYSLQKGARIGYHARLGVLSLVATQPYSGFDEQWIERAENLSLLISGDWMSFGKLFRMEHTFSYSKSLGTKYELGANLSLAVMRLESYRTVAFVSQSLSLSLYRKF